MTRPVVVVGSVNLDLVCTVDRIPVAGETLVGCAFRQFHGGKGANQAVAVARLAYPVSMVAKVGDDEFGRELRLGLQSAGVDIRSVGTAKNTSSGVALIAADRQGRNSIVVVPGANGQLLPRDLEKALPVIRSAGILLAQLEIPFETVDCLANFGKRCGIPVILDPSPARHLPPELLKNVVWITPNETETLALCNSNHGRLSDTTAPLYARELQSCGTRNVVIKMGDQGAFVRSDDHTEHYQPAFRVHAVDSTGAGDAFNGGLAVALMRGQTAVRAVSFACAVAALSVTRMGAQPSMPTLREVSKLLRSRGAYQAKSSQCL